VPSLGYKPKHYVFPVDGGASYVDTYGAGRSDIYDGWHHGDDLFAPLGTPVVAVARGTLSLVGWNSSAAGGSGSPTRRATRSTTPTSPATRAGSSPSTTCARAR
jgi:hypothetical protein